MPRTHNALNIEAFHARKKISTSSNKDVLHLATVTGSPVERFVSLVRHQENFLNWIDKRHTMLQEAHEALGKNSPKTKVFLKYNWYSKQLVLLESINAFEKFYKSMIVELCDAIRPYVKATGLKPFEIDAAHLFGDLPNSTLITAYFESRTYHNPDAIDSVTNMLIGKKRYDPSQLASKNKEDVKQRKRCLQAIFQIRHTLSHNNGFVTDSDAVKLKKYGLLIQAEGVIDPNKDHLREAICRFMIDEALSYHEWLMSETTMFLRSRTSELECDLDLEAIAKLKALFEVKTRRIKFEF